jgi:hypothetical protein
MRSDELERRADLHRIAAEHRSTPRRRIARLVTRRRVIGASAVRSAIPQA